MPRGTGLGERGTATARGPVAPGSNTSVGPRSAHLHACFQPAWIFQIWIFQIWIFQIRIFQIWIFQIWIIQIWIYQIRIFLIWIYQIWVFQIAKSDVTQNQQQQFTMEHDYKGMFTRHSVISNSATNFVGLRMKAWENLGYKRITDPHIWQRQSQWDDSRIPNELKERMGNRIKDADNYRAKQ